MSRSEAPGNRTAGGAEGGSLAGARPVGPPARVTRACLLAFVTAGTTLATQVLVHRLVSAKLLNNYAFLVISLTMLGFALSGVVLSRCWNRLTDERHGQLSLLAALFVVTLVGATSLFTHAEAGSQAAAATRTQFLVDLVRWIPLALVFAAPFTFCGLILGALLANPALPASRVYCFDLVGSAVGALLVIPAIGALGVERTLLAAAAVLLAAAVALHPPRGFAGLGVVAGAALVLVAAAAAWPTVFAFRYPPDSPLGESQRPGGSVVLEHVAWDPVARIEVSRIEPPHPAGHAHPSLIGADRRFHSRFQRLLTQNNFAFTYAVSYDGQRESLRGIEQTIYAAAYQATSVPRPRVLTIGVGGGFDVLTALAFDAESITGVEVNAATVDVLRRAYRDYFRAWVDDPRVRLVQAEGREHLTGSRERYDVLQLSGVDSYSGTPGAAHVFSESYLYTAEAFDLYLSRLSEPGILNLMRLEHVPPVEMFRVLVMAVDALRRAGVRHPREHLLMLAADNGHFASLLLKRTPFEPEERGRVAAWAASCPFFSLAAAPGLPPATSPYQEFLALDGPGPEARYVARYPFDISPVTDDRPFFFKFSLPWHLWSGDDLVRSFVPVMEYSVLVLGTFVGIVAVAGVTVPLRLLARRAPRPPSLGRFGFYFAACGMGYLGIEVGLMQKLGLFLGHPNYAVSVALSALLLGSGFGSLASSRLLRGAVSIRLAAYALACLVLLQQLAVFPALTRLVGLPLPARVLIAFLAIFPVGFVLGVFLPHGLERLKRHSPGHAAWAWGVNGVFSVLAPIVAVTLSMTFGIAFLMSVTVTAYLAAGFALPRETPA